MEQVILVDENDRQTGLAEKLNAHEKALLHRAFSVFLHSPDKSRLLLQKRAAEKYHCGGLWANTCCSHPRPGESVADAACRRLREECGILGVPLTEQFSFCYRAALDHGLTEHELDHVLMGEFHGSTTPDPAEVAELRWVEISHLEELLQTAPEQFAPWFLQAAPRVIAHLKASLT